MTKKRLTFGREVTGHESRALGVYLDKDKVYLFQVSKAGKFCLQLDRSVDKFDFNLYDHCGDILVAKDKKEEVNNLSDFRITKMGSEYFLAYKIKSKQKNYLASAVSSDLIHWEHIGKISTPAETGMLVPNYKFEDKFINYFGEKSLYVASSFDLKNWEILGGPFSHLAEDKNYIKISEIEKTNEGILMVYFQYKKNLADFKLKVALFDRRSPSKLLWDKVVWKETNEWDKKVAPIGTILAGSELVFYWQGNEGQVFSLVFPYFRSVLSHTKPVFISPVIDKFRNNPILKPIVRHFWESKAVFNPTAFYDKGDVHIVYRAVGDDDVSVLGYAKSHDGVNIDERLSHPIYVPTQLFEGGRVRKRPKANMIKRYVNPKLLSGPGWGGVEDPRITKIDDRIYMLYVAFDGWRPQRLALTSIASDDFQNHRWNWTKSVLVSPPGEAHKNWVIFPEKISGKFAILHSITPSISIEYLDSLDFENTEYISSTWEPVKRHRCWDNYVRGAGPPPIKTKDGWLLFYHAMDIKDPGKYKLGAMLLDYSNPERILHRSKTPILEPDKTYENDGFKAGVVFACGALAIKDTLHLYYGGSDTYVCAATANLPEFLDQLKASKPATLEASSPNFSRNILH